MSASLLTGHRNRSALRWPYTAQSRNPAGDQKMKKLIAAIGVGILAFFELCFTGKATKAWELARKEDSQNEEINGDNCVSDTCRL